MRSARDEEAAGNRFMHPKVHYNRSDVLEAQRTLAHARNYLRRAYCQEVEWKDRITYTGPQDMMDALQVLREGIGAAGTVRRVKICRIIMMEGPEDLINTMLEPSWLQPLNPRHVNGVVIQETARIREVLCSTNNAHERERGSR